MDEFDPKCDCGNCERTKSIAAVVQTYKNLGYRLPDVPEDVNDFTRLRIYCSELERKTKG